MDNRLIITSFLDGSAYTNINHNMIIGLGGNLYEAFLLSRLLNLYSYFAKNNLLQDGWFFQTIDDITDNCGISEAKQRHALQSLQARGLIEIKLKGSPPKRHFKVEVDKVVELFSVTKTTTTKMQVVKQESIKTKKEQQQEFFDQINRTFREHDSFPEVITALGNIPEELGYFMWLWSRIPYNQTWTWDSKKYGILRSYMRHKYSGKQYDFHVIREYLGCRTMGCTLESFIKFDRTRLESKKKYVYDSTTKGLKWQ